MPRSSRPTQPRQPSQPSATPTGPMDTRWKSSERFILFKFKVRPGMGVGQACAGPLAPTASHCCCGQPKAAASPVGDSCRVCDLRALHHVAAAAAEAGSTIGGRAGGMPSNAAASTHPPHSRPPAHHAQTEPCPFTSYHNYKTCPYSHCPEADRVQRRDPLALRYVPVPCPYLDAGSCSLVRGLGGPVVWILGGAQVLYVTPSPTTPSTVEHSLFLCQLVACLPCVAVALYGSRAGL